MESREQGHRDTRWRNMTPALRALVIALDVVVGHGAAAQDTPAEDPATEGAPAEDAAPQAEAPAVPAAATDPTLDEFEHRMRLIPLTADQLEAAAGDWRGRLQAATEAEVEQRIQVERAEGAAAEAARERLLALTEARNHIDQRYALTLDEWRKKGGDPAVVDGHAVYRRSIQIEQTRSSDVRTIATQAGRWLIAPDGGLGLLTRTGIVASALLGLFIVARLVRRIARRAIERVPNLSKLLQGFLLMAVYWLTLAVGLMIVLSAVGMDITPVFALIGGASFIIAFAMQDTLGNLAAGLMIMINRPFDEGDYVDIGGVAGTVKSVSIVSTTVTTPDNQVIVVPNSKVWGNVITNVTASPTRRVDLVFGIAYEDSIETAQKVLEDVVAAHPLVLEDPSPVIRVNELAESSVNFVCRPWVNGEDYWTVHWDLTRQVKEAFDAAGISIPYPQTDLHIRPGSGDPADAAFRPAKA